MPNELQLRCRNHYLPCLSPTWWRRLGAWHAKVDWNTLVHGTGYAQFLGSMFFQDRLCGLLGYFKNAPFRHVNRSTQALSDRLDTIVNRAETKLVGGSRVTEAEEVEIVALEDQLKGDETYAKESFYKDLGPGMETHDDAMGYNASFPFHDFPNLTDIIILDG